MIFNVSGGGGTALNFKVLGGTAQPSDPGENTIWVYTEYTLTSWEFSAVEPGNPAEGTVWFAAAAESPAEFNALKKSAIRIYPVSAKQYLDGVWVDVDAFIFKNGVRVRISSGLVYYILNGTSLPDYNGGWKGTGTAEVSTSPMTTGYISINTSSTTSGQAVMDTPISAFGRYSTLKFVGHGSQNARFLICSGSGKTVATKYFPGGSSQVTASVDISELSKDETYSCGLSIPLTDSSASAKVSQIWLE